MSAKQDEISVLINTCRMEQDMDCKVSLFNLIMEVVSSKTGSQIKAPSLLTDDFINSALDGIKY